MALAEGGRFSLFYIMPEGRCPKVLEVLKVLDEDF